MGWNWGSPSGTKFLPLDEVLSTTAGLPPNEVVSVTIRKPGNFSVRADQSPRSRAATVLVGVCASLAVMEQTKSKARAYVRSGRYWGVLLMSEAAATGWSIPWGVHAGGRAETADQFAAAYGVEWELEAAAVAATKPTQSLPISPTSQIPLTSLVVDERTRRMLTYRLHHARP